MAVRLITGVPRCGKSYMAVHKIAKDYCNKVGDTFMLKPDITLITNIEGLVVEHYTVEEIIQELSGERGKEEEKSQNEETVICPECQAPMKKKTGSYGPFYSCSKYPQCKKTLPVKASGAKTQIEIKDQSRDERLSVLFSEDGFQKLREKFGKNRIVLIIDECQIYFHKRFYNRDVFYAFEIHGHYGLDILLIAHHIGKVCRDITDLIEFETRVIPRTYQIAGINYLERQGFEVVGRGRLSKKQEIFGLYQSEHFKEGEKVKQPFYRWGIYLIIFLALGVGLVYWRFGGKIKAKNEMQNIAQVQVKSAGIPQQITTPVPVIPKEPIKTRSFLSEEHSGYTYQSVDFIRLDGEIRLVHAGNMVPLAIYPYKTKIMIQNGHYRVYALKPAPQQTVEEKRGLSLFDSKPTNQQNPSEFDYEIAYGRDT